jgi:hypothetical protein
MLVEPNPEKLGAKGPPIVQGSETIWEIVKAEDGFGFGLALVRIEGGWNEAHFHEKTKEVYVVVWGKIEVRLGFASGLPGHLRPVWRATNRFPGIGQALAIRGAHQARAHNLDHAWFYVYTFPAFDPADYHLFS